MTWQKLIAYVAGGIALIILGWLLHSAFTPKPEVKVETRIERDTVRVEKLITITKESKPTIIRDTVTQQFGLVDSISGIKNEVAYKTKYSYFDKKGLWDIQLKPLIKTVTQFVTKDSIQTVVDVRYMQAPFFLNPYFYTTIAGVVIAILAIIF